MLGASSELARVIKDTPEITRILSAAAETLSPLLLSGTSSTAPWSSVETETRKCWFYLKRLIEEGFHSLRQTSDQPKRVSQNVQTQDENIHLLEELQQKDLISLISRQSEDRDVL